MRIAHWIIHNEVDGGIHWTNMGDKPIATFMDTYLRSMRMCYNIVHQYDQHSEVFISFSHGWNIAAGGGWYKVRDMLDLMNLFSKAEGVSSGRWHATVIRHSWEILVLGMTAQADFLYGYGICDTEES